jgi:hypothetical protein
MKQKAILILATISFISSSNGQSLINHGADIIISSGSSIVIDGDFENQLDGSVNNSGDILITGDWINNQSSGNLLLNTTGTVRLIGSGVQNFGGTHATYFNNLDMQNDANISGPADISVTSDLILSGTSISLGNNGLVMQVDGEILGAGSSGYVITNGSGKLTQYVNANNKLFPVGSNTDYTPVLLNNSGTADYFRVRVFPDVLTNGLTGSSIPEIYDCVDMTWDISENVSGGSNLAITAYWENTIEGTSFDRTHCAIGHYTGGSWDGHPEGAASGSNPYSITRTGITTLSAFAVGDAESPMVITLDLDVDVTALLEGPFYGSEMLPSLNVGGLIPFNQPYNTSPWNYSGSESVAAIPNANVVDWVLVELRDAEDAVLALPETVIEQQAAFVLKDGTIVGMDGSSPLACAVSSITNDLYVVIYHRNHLAVMSADPLSQTAGVYMYNFTTGASQAYENGADGQKEIATGIWGMFGGDANADGNIETADKVIWGNQAGTKGYSNSDFDMNAQVNNQDKNELLVPNNNSHTQVPD